MYVSGKLMHRCPKTYSTTVFQPQPRSENFLFKNMSALVFLFIRQWFIMKVVLTQLRMLRTVQCWILLKMLRKFGTGFLRPKEVYKHLKFDLSLYKMLRTKIFQNVRRTWSFSPSSHVHVQHTGTQKFLLRKSYESFDTGSEISEEAISETS